MEAPVKIREPVLWWIAGADARVLSDCPRSDQIFIQHLGLSLIGAFIFVFLISTVSILVAFPDLANSSMATAFAVCIASLIAAMVFLIDRLFIQADWGWQAAKQRAELARAAWEGGPIHETLSIRMRELGWAVRAGRFAARFFVLSFRVLLSLAIGLTIASFLELVIYKDEIKPLIQRLHYEDNKAIYDEINDRKAQLEAEVQVARGERNRLLASKVELEAELKRLELTPPSVPSDGNTSALESQIRELRGKVADEQPNIRKYAQDMVGEFRGTMVNPGNSGIAGQGQRYLTALDLKRISESNIAELNEKIAALEVEKRRIISNRDAEVETARGEVETRKDSLRAELRTISDNLATAQATLTRLENGLEATIEQFMSALKKKPNFVPLSFGAASQFRALRTLYREYGSTFEMIMIKLLIIMLEMMPVLQKVFLSPATLYAVRLDAEKRSKAYVHFDEELKLRQDYLRRKADAAMDEALDGQGIERIRQSNVTTMHK